MNYSKITYQRKIANEMLAEIDAETIKFFSKRMAEMIDAAAMNEIRKPKFVPENQKVEIVWNEKYGWSVRYPSVLNLGMV